MPMPGTLGWASRPPMKASRVHPLRARDDLGVTPKPAGGTPTLPGNGLTRMLSFSSIRNAGYFNSTKGTS